MAFFTSCFVTFTVAMLFVGMLGGIYGRGRKRIFLGGFAIGAWGYLVLAYGLSELDNFGHRILTTQALKYIENVFFPEDPSAQYYTSHDPWTDAYDQVNLIGNSVFTLAFGLICALVARRFAHDGSLTQHAARSQIPALKEPVVRREFAAASRDD